jgi:uncharacterized ferritin-like protein (DUF455 family)
MMTYSEFAQQILLGESYEDKLLQNSFDWTCWHEFDLPQMPARNHRLRFSKEQLKFPKANRLAETEKKALALHSFANHELLAIEMMAAAILIYPHRTEEEIRFKKGILAALKDEQKHLSLYVGRLQELGFDLGDFPLNDFFWRQMEKLKTPESYLAVMSLTFEAANLDFAQYYAKIFRDLGDEATASILNTVLEDEVSHVAFGAHWMKKWRQDLTLWDYYRTVLPWPMTPARGKGLAFDPAIHRQGMNDDHFVNELINYQDDFLITKRV